jgi:hypothetical protein
MPCPQLRQLSLKSGQLQLEPASDRSGVLAGCSGLTGLQLSGCAVQDPQAAFAAIAALPELRSLSLIEMEDADLQTYGITLISGGGGWGFAKLQPLTRLTKLQLNVLRLQQP